MDIVNWCNNNLGFLTAILSVLTVFFSFIAIVVSIRTARLPYKRKILLKLSFVASIGGGNKNYAQVEAVNVGQLPIKVESIGLMFKKEYTYNFDTVSDSLKIIGRSESTSHMMDIESLQKLFSQKKYSDNMMIYGFIKDSEGNTYKKKLYNVKKLMDKPKSFE